MTSLSETCGTGITGDESRFRNSDSGASITGGTAQNVRQKRASGSSDARREMRYLQVSERWCADYGVNASQLLGHLHYEVFPDIPRRWREMHRRALEGKTFRAEEDSWDRQGGFATWVRWEIRRTTIHACLPLGSESNSMRATG